MANIPLLLSSELDKYQIFNNTLSREVKSSPKDPIRIWIGDDKQPDFKPQVKLRRWEEADFSMRAEEHPAATVETEGEVIKYKTPNYEVHFKDTPQASEDGGNEIYWVLPKKPKTNVLTSTVQMENLDAFYQPSLTQEEIDEGAEIPFDVEGSYAFYHKTKGGMNDSAGMEYKTGKSHHLYAAFAIDANGDMVKCEYNDDLQTTGLLKVTIPQDFLDNAVYPVVADPTFGYTSIGGTPIVVSGDYPWGFVANPSGNGNITSISVYWNDAPAGSKAKAVLWSLSGTDATRVVTATERTSFTNDAWNTDNVSSTAIYSATSYAISANQYGPAYTNRDAVGTNTKASFGYIAYASWPEATDEITFNNFSYSIYATYTASGTFPVRESVTDTDFATSVTSMAVNMPATVDAGDRLIALCHVRNAGTWSTVPTDWSNLAEQVGGASVGELSIFEKIADGTEDGGTATWITDTGTSAAWQVIRVSGAHASTASEVGTTSGDSSSANPPSKTISGWTGENTLWLAIAGHSAVSTTPFSAAPAGFSGFAQNGASSGGAATAVAHGYSGSSVDTYDPDIFTVDGSNRYWAAATLAIRPAAAAAESASLSPSISASVSPSVSPSASLSPSISPSPSPSLSPSISPSISPSASLSPSISPSISPSVSPSASISPSISPSVSPSASLSPSISPSVSPSVSPSASLSPSISPSISPSASLSPSLSPSVSSSVSPSASLSPSISPSISASLSPSVSPSVSPSASLSPSISPSISASISPSLSLSISPSVSPSASISPSLSPSISPSVSPSASISPSLSPSLSPSISPSVSPSASISPSLSPSISPSVSPSAAATATRNYLTIMGVS